MNTEPALETVTDGVRFGEADWQRVRADYRAWWAGALDRALVPLYVNGLATSRPRPTGPAGWLLPQFPPATAPATILDAWEYAFSTTGLLGDAYPRQLLNYGPGALAVAFGARPEVQPTTVWFHPGAVTELAQLDFSTPDLAHPWFLQMTELIAAAAARWGNRVQLDMTDMASPLDVLQMFRRGDQLPLDLYDAPATVTRLAGQIEAGWWALWRHLDAALRAAGARGFGSWGGLFSETSHYMFQCDFAYMIGPAQFREFVVPLLRHSFGQVEQAFYHLDGVGQLAHLDLLLAEPDLKGIQWVPGAGQKRLIEWAEVVRRIRSAGKLVQLVPATDVEPPLDQFEALVDKLGSGQGLQLFWTACRPEEVEAYVERLRKLGVPAGAIGHLDQEPTVESRP